MPDLPDQIRTRWGRAFSFRERGWAFKRFAKTPDAMYYILPDLAEFTGAGDPLPFAGGPVSLERMAGRRDVWLRITHQINLTEGELYALLRGHPRRSEDGT